MRTPGTPAGPNPPTPEGPLLAACESCSHLFFIPEFVFMMEDQEGNEIELLDSQVVTPCPRCGGRGIAKPRTRRRDVIKALTALPAEGRQALMDAIIELQRVPDAQAVAKEVMNVNPGLAPVASWLGSSSSRMELASWLTFLLTLLMYLHPLDSAPTDGEAKVEQVVVQIVQDSKGPDWCNVGRNQPCPCGSGVKFKRCHGSNLPPTSSPAGP